LAVAAFNSIGRLGVEMNSPQYDIQVLGTSDPASITVDGIGIVGPNFMFRRARGTAAAPTAVQSGDGLLFLVARGYGATGFSSSGRANISMYAAENWSDTAQGTYMAFKTTPTGTTNQTERMRITPSGNIGVGTTTPAYPLDVAGQVHATGFPTSSDMRFKEDITPIDNALEKVLRLNGVYFRWNKLHRETLKRSKNLTSRQVGLIAQQVREVMPELVSEWADRGAEDYLAVDYSRLGAVTIEAIKQLNDKLQADNKAIREENKAIREEIKTLQQTVKRLTA